MSDVRYTTDPWLPVTSDRRSAHDWPVGGTTYVSGERREFPADVSDRVNSQVTCLPDGVVFVQDDYRDSDVERVGVADAGGVRRRLLTDSARHRVLDRTAGFLKRLGPTNQESR